MLILFHGNDTVSVREAAQEYLRAHAPDGATVIDGDTYEAGRVTDAAGSTSLFGDATHYLLDTPSDLTAFAKEVAEALPALASSENVFVVIEGKLLAAPKKQYTKYATVVEERSQASERGFNVFLMGDAFAARDKRTLWVLLAEAFAAGLSAEEIAGTLWWQIKTMRMASVTASSTEAGMKDFPYNKAKRSLKNFKEGELAKCSQELLAVYHEARQGKLELDLALERWVLSL
jgi:DNA polymerase III delta subunit